MISVTRTPFQATNNGTHLSVPVENEMRQFSCFDEEAHDAGYDSDGQLGPFFDAVSDEAAFEEYEEAGIIDSPPPPPPINAGANAEAEAPPVLLSDSRIRAMKVSELRDELRKRKLSSNGLKADLVARLIQNAHLPTSSSDDPSPAEEDNQPFPCYHPSARWRLLELDTTSPLQNPNNLPGLVAPTVHATGGTTEPQKFNINEVFDRDPFISEAPEYELDRHGKIRKDRDGNPIMVNKLIKKGRPKQSFLQKHKLTSDSHPAEWFGALLPDSVAPSDGKNGVCLDQWTTFTNLKAFLAQAGTKIYSGTFTPFTTPEIKRFIGLLLIHGLSPSPRVSYKFKAQDQDPINGNDLVNESFGSNAEKRYKQWKSFFGVQDPRKELPSTKTHPNFKIDPFLFHMQKVSMQAWEMGEVASCDEQDVGFTGRHQDKQRINYKDEGDGFLADSICQDGYTWNFYFRNVPPPKHYVDKGYSPTHARVLFLFDSLEKKNHIVGLDNLFMSAKLAWGAYTGKNQVMIHGVVRKTGRGVPGCVLQETRKNPNEAALVRGTIKAAVLEGDPKCPNVCVLSFYDNKDVYIMSTSCTEMKWVEKTPKVFHKETQKMVQFKYLRHQLIDDYNNFMNKVDQADQLRSAYRCDHWTRTRKWWWAIWLWGLQVLLVNAYVLYKHAHIYIWKTKPSQILTHFQFRRLVALHWLNPDLHPISTDGKKRKRNSAAHATSATPNTRSSSVASSSNNTTKASYVNDDTLSEDGALKCRLSCRFFHCPVRPVAKDPSCSLHRWASGDKTYKHRAQVMTCDCCNVNLCLDCFGPFHTISDVRKLQSEIQKIMWRENHN